MQLRGQHLRLFSCGGNQQGVFWKKLGGHQERRRIHEAVGPARLQGRDEEEARVLEERSAQMI